MHLTPAQLAILKAAIVADPALSALPNDPDGNQAIVAAMDAVAVPDYWAWRTSVSEAEYVGQASVDGTDWSWTSYIGRNQGERDGWGRLFATGSVNPARTNVRAAIADIFSGAGGLAQRTHLLAASRRRATRGEKLFAVATPNTPGTPGTAAAPATLVVEGGMHREDVERARNLPA